MSTREREPWRDFGIHLVRPHFAGPFRDAFGAVLDDLADCYWMVSLSEWFRHPDELRASSSYDEERDEFTTGPLLRFENLWIWGAGEFSLWRPGLFPELAASVPDDWSTQIALRHAPPDPRLWVESFWSDRKSQLERTASAYILNVDNAYWSIYVRNATLLARIRASLDPSQYSISPADLGDEP